MTEHAHEDHGSLYFKILAILTSLTILTVVVSSKFGMIDYSSVRWLALLIAFVIASTKATLVALYFMHLKYEDLHTWLYVIFPITLVAIMMGGILLDNPLRPAIHPVEVVDPLAPQTDAPKVPVQDSGHEMAHHS